MTFGIHGIYLKFGSFNGIDPIVPNRKRVPSFTEPIDKRDHMDKSKASPNKDGRGYDVYCLQGHCFNKYVHDVYCLQGHCFNKYVRKASCFFCFRVPKCFRRNDALKDIDGSDFWLGILSPQRRHRNCAQCNRSRSAGERVLISIVKETKEKFQDPKSRTCGRNDVLKRKLGVVSIRTSGLGAISEETELEKSHSIIKVGNLGKGSSRQNNTRERRRDGQEERYGSDIQGRIQQHKLSSLARRKLLGGYCEC
jgi:hypothetical protein